MECRPGRKEELEMALVLNCGEVMRWDCQAEVRADTREEVIRQATEHARAVHDLAEVDDALRERWMAAIRTES